MTEASVILVTLIVYKLLLLWLGWLAHRRTQDEADYFLGGRKLGPWVAALSASASSSSAWTLLGVSGAAYAWGLSSIFLIPACVGGFALNWYLLAGPLQRQSLEHNALTTTELLAGPKQQPLHRAIVWLSSVIIIFSLTVYVASQFQGAGKSFHQTFGLAPVPSILLGSAVVILYTMWGGFWAVSLTDTLQGMVMVVTAVILPVVGLVAVGGPVGLIEGLAKVESAGFSSLLGGRGWGAGALFVAGILGIGLGYPGQPHVVNRFMALQNHPNSLRTARRVAMTWAWLVYVGMFVLGLCGRILIPQLHDKEVVFLALAKQLTHPIVAGVMLAAVLSAIMSTADSQLLVAASSIAHDLMKPSTQPKQLLWRARLVVLVLSLCSMILAIFGAKEIFSSVLFAWTAMGSAFGPLLLISVLRGPVTPAFTVAAMSAGFFLSVLFYSIPATKSGFFERVIPFAISAVLAWWGSRPKSS